MKNKLFTGSDVTWSRHDTVNSGITFSAGSTGKFSTKGVKGRPSKYGREVTFYINSGEYTFTQVGGDDYRTKSYPITVIRQNIEQAESFLNELTPMKRKYGKVT